MNETYYNGKYNIITPEMDLTIEGFKIRKKELDNDMVYSGNLILKKEFKELNNDKIFSLPLDEKTIYVNNVNYSHIHDECSIDDSIVYCGSFVLWLLTNHHRNNETLFSDMRSHRIVPKVIWECL